MSWRSFDVLARTYHALESVLFGRRLWRARLAHLDALRGAKRVLILGEGDGRFLAALLAENPSCVVHVVDKSEKMLTIARKRVAALGNRVRFIQADASDAPYDPPYDGIVSLFFLDCFENPEQALLIEALSRLAAPEAQWLHCDFQLGSPGWRGLWHRLWVWALYRAFRATTDIRARRWEDPFPAFDRLGWRIARDADLARGLLRSCQLTRAR